MAAAFAILGTAKPKGRRIAILGRHAGNGRGCRRAPRSPRQTTSKPPKPISFSPTARNMQALVGCVARHTPRRLCAHLRRTRAAGPRSRQARRCCARQRFVRQPHVGDRGCAEEGKPLMLPYFLVPLSEHFSALNVFRYISFRAGGAVLTALFIGFLIGPSLIAWLKVKQGKGQPIRADGPQRHIVEKQGTPTMGGLLILIPLVDLHLVVGRTDQSLCLGDPAGGGHLWSARLFGRLQQGDEAFVGWAQRQAAPGCRIRRRLSGDLVHHVARRTGACGNAQRSLLEERAGAIWPVVHRYRRFRDRGRIERGEFHRWSRRAGHRAGDDRGGDFCADRLSRRQREIRRLSATALCGSARANLPCSLPR